MDLWQNDWQKKPHEGKYDKAALFFNVLKLFPSTATISISQAKEAKQFTCEKAQDHTLWQRVCQEAQCNNLHDAAFQIVLTAACKFVRKAAMVNAPEANAVEETTVLDLSYCTPDSIRKHKD